MCVDAELSRIVTTVCADTVVKFNVVLLGICNVGLPVVKVNVVPLIAPTVTPAGTLAPTTN